MYLVRSGRAAAGHSENGVSGQGTHHYAWNAGRYLALPRSTRSARPSNPRAVCRASALGVAWTPSSVKGRSAGAVATLAGPASDLQISFLLQPRSSSLSRRQQKGGGKFCSRDNRQSLPLRRTREARLGALPAVCLRARPPVSPSILMAPPARRTVLQASKEILSPAKAPFDDACSWPLPQIRCHPKLNVVRHSPCTTLPSPLITAPNGSSTITDYGRGCRHWRPVEF